MNRSFCLFLAGLIFLASHEGARADIGWQLDYADAIHQAAEQGKFILLDFNAPGWSAPCQEMEENIFSKPEWAAFAAKNLILLRFDFDRLGQPRAWAYRDQHLYFFGRYAVKGFPTFILLSPRGIPIARQQGAFVVGVPAFIQWIRAMEQGT